MVQGRQTLMLYSAHIFIMLAGTNFFAFLDQSAEISNVSVPTKNSHLKVVLIISVPTCPTNQKKKTGLGIHKCTGNHTHSSPIREIIVLVIVKIG